MWLWPTNKITLGKLLGNSISGNILHRLLVRMLHQGEYAPFAKDPWEHRIAQREFMKDAKMDCFPLHSVGTQFPESIQTLDEADMAAHSITRYFLPKKRSADSALEQ